MAAAEPVVEDNEVSSKPEGLVRLKRVLVSVSDKTSIVELCRYLAELGVEIISTGGSARTLMDNGIAVVEVSDYTKFPELLDGRLKTLNPKIHGGLLGIRGNKDHEEAMKEHGILPIDACVVNLYPFQETVKSGADFNTCVENIDIGGPAMIRAAAKNFSAVTVVTDVDQYTEFLTELTELDGRTSLKLRQKYAGAALARTAAYDAAIAGWFSQQSGSPFPEKLVLSATLKHGLRYGENPHQNAAFYVSDTSQRVGVATSEVVQGKELSFNNISDTEAAFELVSEFDEPAVAIIKHANPCGAAVGVNSVDAYLRALACDPVSAFGGIVAFNRTIDKDAAEEVIKVFTEVVIGPDATAEALQVFSAKKNLRVLLTGSIPKDDSGWVIKSVSGGYLVQDRDGGSVTEAQLKVVTKRSPTPKEMSDMLFAWKVCKHIKSNAIVFAKEGSTVGQGAGQMSRVDSARIAALKAKDASDAAQEEAPRTQGSVVASDAFFPFPDGLIVCAEAGATAIIQPGGSKRDQEVIEAADSRNMAMVFTQMRHFRH